MKNLFQKALARQNSGTPPIWFMRQAGRYHAHYQELRKKHSFMDLCKNPELAAETALGPVQDFGFDAAILFSDLLFPLEAMGMGLTYPVSGPVLEWHLKTKEDLKKLRAVGSERIRALEFQGQALRLTRERIPSSCGLLGFVGGPLTLFSYAVEGSHRGGLSDTKKALKDGRYEGFLDRLIPLLAENILIQIRAGADSVMLIDTSAGELDAEEFSLYCVPALSRVFKLVHQEAPQYPIAYYSRGTRREHWQHLTSLPLQYLGVDWTTRISEVLREYGERWCIQGNFSPEDMHLEPALLEPQLNEFFEDALSAPTSTRKGWICGLGHGILPKTPEENVRLFIQTARRILK